MSPDEQPRRPPRGSRPLSPQTRGGMRPPGGPGSPAQSLALCVIIGLGVVVFGAVANEHFPLRHWLFFMLVRRWLLGALFAAACLSTGLRVSRWLIPGVTS